MKKHLIALVALAASSAALAQSSVTLYGVADVGVGKLGKGMKTEMISGTIINHQNSYLGFRGVEDLGGGLKAGFNFEQGINLENGGAHSESSQGDLVPQTMWQRAANVWIGGSWGTFKIGRALAPSYNALVAWDILGNATYSALLNGFGYVGGDTEYRNSSQFSYKTPDLGGFSAELGYILKADNQDRAKVDLGLIYANGPLTTGLSYNKTKSRKANYAIGAQYNFGAFALATGYFVSNNHWVHDSGTGQFTGNISGRLRGFSLGGRVAFGAMSVALDLTRHTKADYMEGGVRYNDKKRTQGTLEAKYALSKRTFAYAAYARYWDENLYGVGLQHRF